ncbi:PKD domain-containing protein [Candidatus Aciduliprofundum boonei]|uniref:PKD domain containing protein n=1 Tax=Aciduliprofundum boonei (strain DSM 19572 / T469) TaxID=439481 RepID=D3TBL7_ACIB4|nr:PKD domain-containing protein [Candidatus Aciduliprofundum boonei]ADD07952.1 PKD domain containing protein [Aciduliprofundum boonei T469]
MKVETKRILLAVLVISLVLVSGFSVMTGNASAQTNTSSQVKSSGAMEVSTDLGNNTALLQGSVGITLPNAINKEYTKSPGIVIGNIWADPHYPVVGEPTMFTVSGGVTGGVPPYHYTWTFDDGSIVQGTSAVHIFKQPGVHIVSLTVKDGVGNTATTTKKVYVDPKLEVSVTVDTQNPAVGEKVFFSYKITGGFPFYINNHTYYKMYVDFGDGWGHLYGYYAPTGTFNYTYTNPGEYLIYVRAWDNATNWYTWTYRITITYSNVNTNYGPLDANVTISPNPGFTYKQETLKVWPINGTGIYNITVLWGDGNHSYWGYGYVYNPPLKFYHTYKVPGNYQIKVYVNDSLGDSVEKVRQLRVFPGPLKAYLGNMTQNSTGAWVIFNTTSPKVVTPGEAAAGINLYANITGGTPGYTWQLINATTNYVVATGTTALPSDTPFYVWTFDDSSPGTYHFVFKVTDHTNNIVYSNTYTIIVKSANLTIQLLPASVNVPIGGNVSFVIDIWNIQLNSSGAATINVTFYNGTGSWPTWYHVYTFTNGTPGAIIYNTTPFEINESTTPALPVQVYGGNILPGDYTAKATVNYGSAYNATNHETATSIVHVVSYPPISYVIWSEPYPAKITAGLPITIYVNISGGDGLYSVNFNPNGTVSNVYTNDVNETISGPDSNGNWTVSNLVYYTAPDGKRYYNMSFVVVYSTPSPAQGYVLDGNVLSNAFTQYKGPFKVTIYVTPPSKLQVEFTGSSHYSYALPYRGNQTLGPHPLRTLLNDSYSFTLWLNISGGVPPYHVSMYFDGSVWGVVYLNGEFYGWVNSTTTSVSYWTDVYPVGATKEAHYKFVLIYNDSYADGNMGIEAYVVSNYPSSFPYRESLYYTVWAEPYLTIASIDQSAYSISVPGSVSFVVNAMWGDISHTHDYTYVWLMHDSSTHNYTIYAITSVPMITIEFENPDIYSVAVVVVSNVINETATAVYEDINATMPPTIVQVVSVRVEAELVNPSGNSYIAYAGWADWDENGTIMASFVMPNVPNVNAVYTLEVTYSYTLAITNYDTYTHTWQTYFYNAYSAHPYATAQLTVIAQGNVGPNLDTILAAINGVWHEVNVSRDNLMNAINNGFTSVENGIVEIKTMGSTLNAKLSDLNANITDIQNGIATIKTDIGNIQTSLNNLDAKITDIQNGIATIKTDIGNIQTSLNNLDAKITDIQNGIATIKTDIGNIQTSLNNLDAKITKLQGDVATIQTDIGTVNVKLDAINATVVSNANGIKDLKGSIVTIQTTLGDIKGTVTDIKNGVATIQTDLGTMQTDVSNIKTSTSNTASGINTAIYWNIGVLILVIITLILVAYVLAKVNKISQAPKEETVEEETEEETKEE